jgi:hypothetical protein
MIEIRENQTEIPPRRADYITVLPVGDKAYRIAAAAGMILLASLCAWRSARLALATTSLGLTQDDAEYHVERWQNGTAENPGELDRALALNPRDTAAWIALGLQEEAAGRRQKAEAALLHAAEIDHTYLPRWTLTNYYFRQDKLPDFWIWARRAAEMAYDPGGLFQLCWRASSDARLIQDRVVPAEPGMRRAYLDFLVRTNRLDAARPLAQQIGRTADASDLARLLEYCDAEIVRGHVNFALEVWNALAARSVVPYGALDPAAGVSMTNGAFAAQPLQRGFDWRVARVDGASLSVDTAAHEMVVSLEGRQAEFCDFVEQYVPVLPGSKYRLHYRYRTRDLPTETGLGFILLDARTAGEFASGAAPASSGDWAERDLAFSTPSGCEMIRILLRYRRAVGSVRAEGGAVFAGLTLERAN